MDILLTLLLFLSSFGRSSIGQFSISAKLSTAFEDFLCFDLFLDLDLRLDLEDFVDFTDSELEELLESLLLSSLSELSEPSVVELSLSLLLELLEGVLFLLKEKDHKLFHINNNINLETC